MLHITRLLPLGQDLTQLLKKGQVAESRPSFLHEQPKTCIGRFIKPEAGHDLLGHVTFNDRVPA